MQEEVWVEYIQGTLLDYDGWAAFSGVPKGRNWASNLYLSAASHKNWLQIHATSYDNPYINPATIDAIRDDSNTSDRFFRQEYGAEILDDGGIVFRNVRACATAEWQEKAIQGHEYAFGLDWGKTQDFTVITCYDLTLGAFVWLDRFNKIDYNFQLERLKVALSKFRPRQVYAESNSIGEALIDHLRDVRIPVIGMHANNATKDAWIQALAIAFEKKDIAIVNDETFIGELHAYEGHRLSSGRMSYSAPDGMHDDIVMSAAICYAGAVRRPVRLEASQSPFHKL